MRYSGSSSVETSSRPDPLTGDLRCASIVFCAGRGLGCRENMTRLATLARPLGAQIGATRGAVDLGWLGRDREIGLSGLRLRPELYVGFGVSGANFHTIGIEHAGAIVAVNPDPKARIHELAHISVLAPVQPCLEALAHQMHDFPIPDPRSFLLEVFRGNLRVAWADPNFA